MPFPRGYWLEIYAEEYFEGDALMATDDAVPMHTIAEIYIQVSSTDFVYFSFY